VTTTAHRKILAALLAAPVVAVIGVAGTASANTYTADADCSGLVFDMPRTEDGTTVTATVNGRTVRVVTNDTFGAPVRFTVPTPDATQPQAWRVTVVGFNGSAPVFTETVPACVVPTTTTVAPTTTAAATTTTAPATTVPTVAVTTPPVPSSTTTTVRPPRATTTTAAPAWVGVLPETGPSAIDVVAIGGLIASALGAAALYLVRRPTNR
jgi:LPXTG-motif cell wall-anchored protein